LTIRTTLIFILICTGILAGCGSQPAPNSTNGETEHPPAVENPSGDSIQSAGGDEGIGYGDISETDIRSYESLLAWIEEKDASGWAIPGSPDASYTGLLKDHAFRNNEFSLAIDGDAINPYHQRSLMEMIVRKWISFYPREQQPAGMLRVVLYDKVIDPDKELGYSEIDRNRNINTVHPRTADII
jgi:hypothetical protein